MKLLYWFRNDLRLHDNEVFQYISQYAESWLPVYCLHENELAETSLGFPKAGKFRLQFLKESLHNLNGNLQPYNAEVQVFKGNTVAILKQLITENNIDTICFHEEAAYDEIKEEKELIAYCNLHNIKVISFWGSTLYHKNNLVMPLEKLPDIFTQFRQKHEKYGSIQNIFSKPEKLPACLKAENVFSINIDEITTDIEIDNRAAIRFKGGETEALKRLNYYLFESKKIEQYKFTRNQLLGSDYSSKFSPWLALGCISAKTIYHAIKNYEATINSNESTYWLVFELIWRDYFRFVTLKYGNSIFKKGGIKKLKTIKIPMHISEKQQEIFIAWCNGETGIPFIDANMLELKTTGFMSNRGRQNVASFLVKDLKLDWRWGAAWFESLLIDYDVCSNYGNWNYVAGIGNDPRENRYFNILFQAEKYDGDGRYVKHWLPQLQLLPEKYIHQPYLLSNAEKQFYHIQEYPQPILDIEKWQSFVLGKRN